MKTCKQCSTVITGKKKFCNDACRMAFKRNPNQPEQESEQITPQPEHLVIKPNIIKPKANKSEQPEQISTKANKVPTPEQFRLIKSKLAGGVSQPTGLPTAETAALSALDLRNRVSAYVGQAWMSSPEYAEVCLRLVTWTKARLIESGQAVPAWKDTL